MVSLNLLLALATSAATAAAKDIQPTGFKAHHLDATNPLPPGLSPRALTYRQAATCSTFQDLCDGDFCIPSTATCCGSNNGAYCEIGKRCIKQGCCPIGENCIGKPKCDSDEELCGTFCMPKGSVCCEDQGGSYCDEGAKCTSTGCSGGKSSGDDGKGGGVIGDTPRLGGDEDSSGGGGGSGGSSGGGSSGGGGSEGGSSGGSGGGSGGPKCFDFQTPCGSKCMPDSGAVCCDGKYYCFAGSECKDDGTCGFEGGWPPGGSSTTTATTSSASGSGLLSLPTGPRSGDDTLSDDDSDDSSSNSNNNDDGPSSGGGGSSSSNEDGEADAGVIHGPSLAAAVVIVAALLM